MCNGDVFGWGFVGIPEPFPDLYWYVTRKANWNKTIEAGRNSSFHVVLLEIH